MIRTIGALAILLGTVVVGFSPNRWDMVIVDLPRGHGIHAHDVAGMVLVLLGIAALWHVPQRN